MLDLWRSPWFSRWMPRWPNGARRPAAPPTPGRRRRTGSSPISGTMTTTIRTPPRPSGPRFQSGGDRPYIASIEPKRVAFPSSYRRRQHRHRPPGPAAIPHPVVAHGAALPDFGRPRRLQLDGHREDQPRGGVARLASAGGNARARSQPAREDERRHQEPARCQGALSRQLALSHPRHQRCQVDRPGGVVGMLPHAQRTRRRPREPRRCRHAGDGRAPPAARTRAHRRRAGEPATESASARATAGRTEPNRLRPA